MLKELEWIHDCVLSDVRYDASDKSSRSVVLTINCPTDLGYAPWEGRVLVLTAVDVAAFRYMAWGIAGGEETIAAIRPGISNVLRESTTEAKQSGVCFPCLEVTVVFNSGSLLELICRNIEIIPG